MKPLLALLMLVLVVGCTSAENQFRLEERGEGWKLKLEDRGKGDFSASWTKGDHASVQLLNYHPAERGDYTVVNTLYLELDGSGKIVRGMLKRFAVQEISERAYAETRAGNGAKWWRAIEGWCRLDEKGYGTVKARFEGAYEFEGNVEPRDNLEIKRPE